MRIPESLRTILLLIILLVPADFAPAAVRGNDNFNQRFPLPSGESVEAVIRRPRALSYEPLDPMYENDWSGYSSEVSGSLWWEWTAPRDGWFTVAAVNTDGWGWPMQTQVSEGTALEKLVHVANGNLYSTGPEQAVTFEAKQGRKYQIEVRSGRQRFPKPGSTDETGKLNIAPSPGPPANHTMATRAVLSGPLPITVRTSNLAPASQELDRVNSMMSLTSGGYYGIGRIRPVLWWEWTCPASGWYDLRAAGVLHQTQLARRRSTPEGPAPAGDWDNSGIINRSEYFFQAAAGEVFDIALASLGGSYSNYGDLTLTLKAAPSTLPANADEATPTLLPAAVPFHFEDAWPGSPLPGNAGGGGFVQRWYRFTAPAAGYYRVTPTYSGPTVIQGEGMLNSIGLVHWFPAGGGLLLRYDSVVNNSYRMELDVSTVAGTPGSDEFSTAVDLGSAPEFTLLGHVGKVSLEPGDPAPLFLSGESPGTLWWRWTAPSDGWLSRLSGNGGPVQLWAGSSLNSLTDGRLLTGNASVVLAGQTYFLRAGLSTHPDESVCGTEIQFVARALNTTMETAIDLGTSRLPSWEPPLSGSSIYPGSDQWFRWTAAESIRAEFTDYNISWVMTVSAAPGDPPLPATGTTYSTYPFNAGQTYWFQLRQSYNTTDWAMREDPFTAHGDIATALVLDSTLPAGGTISMRGDVNSEEEISLLSHFVWHQWLRGQLPAVWWKWQAPSSGWVRCYADAFANSIYGLYAFDSAGAPQSFSTIGGDYYGQYLRVEQGETYRIAAVGHEGWNRTAVYAHLEIRALVELSPANDSFAGAEEIAAVDWNDYTNLYRSRTGTHRGSVTYDPLFLGRLQAGLEPGEPPVSLILGEEGQAVPQTATTWWHWTPAASAVFEVNVFPADSPARSGGGGAGPANDLTLDIYTGDSLATLHPVPLYEANEGDYIFRATAGTRYYIRVASGSERNYYRLQPHLPQQDDIFDLHAIEQLRFEDIGTAWARLTPDDATNYTKLLFGMDYTLPFDHPANLAAAAPRLPRVVEGTDGIEFRVRPDLRFAPMGEVHNVSLYAQYSTDLTTWWLHSAHAVEGGTELSVRLGPDTGLPRAFLQWDLRQ